MEDNIVKGNLEKLKKIQTSTPLPALLYDILEDFGKRLIQLEKKTIKVVDEDFSKELKKVIYKAHERKFKK